MKIGAIALERSTEIAAGCKSCLSVGINGIVVVVAVIFHGNGLVVNRFIQRFFVCVQFQEVFHEGAETLVFALLGSFHALDRLTLDVALDRLDERGSHRAVFDLLIENLGQIGAPITQLRQLATQLVLVLALLNAGLECGDAVSRLGALLDVHRLLPTLVLLFHLLQGLRRVLEVRLIRLATALLFHHSFLLL